AMSIAANIPRFFPKLRRSGMFVRRSWIHLSGFTIERGKGSQDMFSLCLPFEQPLLMLAEDVWRGLLGEGGVRESFLNFGDFELGLFKFFLESRLFSLGVNGSFQL